MHAQSQTLLTNHVLTKTLNHNQFSNVAYMQHKQEALHLTMKKIEELNKSGTSEIIYKVFIVYLI